MSPAASVAVAVTIWLPFATAVVSHGVPAGWPSTLNRTDGVPEASVAVAARGKPPGTVPATGEVSGQCGRGRVGGNAAGGGGEDERERECGDCGKCERAQPGLER